jgi:hypothetical protein
MTHPARLGFLARQLANLALTANATRPLPGGPASIPAFFAGWLTAELAPHLLTATAADALTHVARRGVAGRTDKLALAAAAASAVGYMRLMGAGQRAGGEVEDALREAFGANYRDELAHAPTPADLATPWRRLINPFRMVDVSVVAHRRLPYAPGGKRFLLDVYTHPDTPKNAPVLFQVHGGAWMIGNKQQQGIPLMMHLAARG